MYIVRVLRDPVTEVGVVKGLMRFPRGVQVRQRRVPTDFEPRGLSPLGGRGIGSGTYRHRIM